MPHPMPPSDRSAHGPPLPPRGVLFGERVHGPAFKLRGRREIYDKLLFIHAGKVALERPDDGDPIVLGAGSFVWIGEGTEHSLLDETPATIFLLCFGRELVIEAAGQEIVAPLRARLSPGLQPDPVTLAEMGRLFREGLLRQGQRRVLGDFALRLLALTILLRLVEYEYVAALAPTPARIKWLLQRIANDIGARWDIEQAARLTGLSRRQFTCAFRAATGTTFLAHLTDLRLHEAAQLIREGRMTIAGAAFCCGFQDLSHFYRLFGRKFGLPPGRFLRRSE